MLTDMAPPGEDKMFFAFFYLSGKIRIFCQQAGDILVERKMRKQRNNINSIAAQAKSPLALQPTGSFFLKGLKRKAV